MLVIAFHEFGHAITACCTGGRVESISLDPHEGGVTHMRGGKQFITLPAGYLGSSLIGALLTFCGFNIVASKIASIVLGVCFLLTLWWARKDWLTIITILLAVGLLVACWFIQHAEALRFVVVFLILLRYVGLLLTLDLALYRRHVESLQCLGHLRRLDSPKGQLIRCQCLCEEVRWLFAVLGCTLVICFSDLDDLRYHCGTGCFPTGLGAAAERQPTLHSDGSYDVEEVDRHSILREHPFL